MRTATRHQPAPTPLIRLMRYHALPIIFALIIAGLFLYDRRPPIAEETMIAEAVPSALRRLEELKIEWSVVRNRFCRSSVSREIVDSVNKVHKYDVRQGRLSHLTGNDQWNERLKLPPDIAWGEAKLRGTTNFYCGTFGNLFPMVVQMPEVNFTVLPDLK